MNSLEKGTNLFFLSLAMRVIEVQNGFECQSVLDKDSFDFKNVEKTSENHAPRFFNNRHCVSQFTDMKEKGSYGEP